MRKLSLGQAIDAAIEDAMAVDDTIVLLGEDVHLLRAPLFARFGQERVLNAPISESAFIGAAVGAAMGGLRPIVELYMVDFMAVAFDAVLNHMAKLEAQTGGQWSCPLLLRAPCGAGYGDGGQHGQTLWGMLASIPGLRVLVPSVPSDAYAMTAAALEERGPVVLMEPKLLSEEWLEFLGRCGRTTMDFDVPSVAKAQQIEPTVFTGRAVVRRGGTDVTLCSMAVGVHRALEAAVHLADEQIDCEVIDLRSLRPLDTATVLASVKKTRRLVVVDEDYRECGIASELAAAALEAGLAPSFARVCVEDTLPYARHLERAALPNVERIRQAVRDVCREHAPVSAPPS